MTTEAAKQWLTATFKPHLFQETVQWATAFGPQAANTLFIEARGWAGLLETLPQAGAPLAPRVWSARD